MALAIITILLAGVCAGIVITIIFIWLCVRNNGK